MSQRILYDKAKVEALAACRMSLQQIADALDINLNALGNDVEQMSELRAIVRRGRAKGEADLRSALFKLAREGDTSAIRELLRVDKSQDID